MVHACNLGTEDVEAAGPEIQGYPRLHFRATWATPVLGGGGQRMLFYSKHYFLETKRILSKMMIKNMML